jgi:glycosyltransferase involved in cell wall biosynthesis
MPRQSDPRTPAALSPEVTVVITVWDDYCEFVTGSVDSALAQDDACEVIVVDNASDRGLPRFDGRVRVLKTAGRLSAGAARNHALGQVETPYVLFLDADDVLQPDSVSILREMLDQNGGAVAAVAKRILWDPETGTQRMNNRSPRPAVYRIARWPKLLSLLTLRYDVFQLTGCALLVTDTVRDAGGFGDASLGEDWMLRSALAARGRIVFGTAGVVLFRVSETSLWQRPHSRVKLLDMYRNFGQHRRADRRLARWVRFVLMPMLSVAHRRDAVRRTRDRAMKTTAGIAEPTQDAALSLSAVICTHDRPADLNDCLTSLGRSCPDLEIVVADSASQTSCRELVLSHQKRLPGLTYIHVDSPGLSKARNAGIDAASGEIIAFLDDDTSVNPGWAKELLAVFAGHPRAGCVGGACLPRFTVAPPAWLSPRLLQLSSITRWGPAVRQPRSSAEWPFGANMSFRKDALRVAGRFDENLGRNGSRSLASGEDSDMVARIMNCGWQVWLSPDASVMHTVHPDRLTSTWYWRRLWAAGASRAKHPSARITSRLTAAVPVRLGLWAITRDRVYLYRLAESTGYVASLLRARCHRARR